MTERESGAAASENQSRLGAQLMRAGSGGFLHHGEWQLARGVGGIEQGGGHVQAAAAIGAGAGTHRQFGHAPAPGLGGRADVVIGNPIADADVHGGGIGQVSQIGCNAIPP